MEYERPLPEGMTEPDPAAVETEAALQLIQVLFNSWPDDKLKAAVDRLRSSRHGAFGDFIAADDVLNARGSERAADILWRVYCIRQDLHLIAEPIEI